MSVEKKYKKLKIAIVHDHLGFMGGGERTALILALALEADFITAYKSDNTFPDYQKKLGIQLIILSKMIIKMRVVRFFWLRLLFWCKKDIFNKYDILIASGHIATEVVSKYGKKNVIRISYTHTTPRRIFDLYEISKKMYPWILQPAFSVFAKFWKRKYLKAIKRFNINIANSKNVKKRIQDHTGNDAEYIVWPPVLTDNFKWESQGDYFLSWARIDEAKRIDLIVKAFKKMPEKKIIIASSGPSLNAIREMAKNQKNISIIGRVSDKKLEKLVNNCLACVYIPIQEDAGLTHLEANSAGKPYLGVKEGGLIESTIDRETGVLIKKEPSIEDFVEGVNMMSAEWCLSKRKICEDYAKKYDKNIFIKKIRKIVNKSIE